MSRRKKYTNKYASKHGEYKDFTKIEKKSHIRTYTKIITSVLLVGLFAVSFMFFTNNDNNSTSQQLSNDDNLNLKLELDTITNLQMGTIERVLAFTFRNKVESGEYIILDIRTPEEFEAGHIPGAINIDFYDPNFQQQIDALNRDKKYLVYCRSGSRTSHTLPLFEHLEFNEVYELHGGAISWINSGFELEGDKCFECV